MRKESGKPAKPVAALSSAFHRGILPCPSARENWLVVNCDPDIPRQWISPAHATCVQSWRPDFLALLSAGYSPTPDFPEQAQSYPTAIVFTGRSSRTNRTFVTAAWNRLKPGGLLVAIGERNTGIGALQSWMEEKTGIVERYSKAHARLFWVRKSGEGWPEPSGYTQIEGFRVAPGMFSADGPDPGSQLLAGHFHEGICGDVCDAGAGWGYLGRRLLETCPDVRSLTSIEADWHSLAAAKANLAQFGEGRTLDFQWLDFLGEATGRFDWIVMNPPFHSPRTADPAIGRGFIHIAAKRLRSGGRLLMVANRHLPYRRDLETFFNPVNVVADSGRYLVFEAALTGQKRRA